MMRHESIWECAVRCFRFFYTCARYAADVCIIEDTGKRPRQAIIQALLIEEPTCSQMNEPNPAASSYECGEPASRLHFNIEPIRRS